jgi:hypothetical protein
MGYASDDRHRRMEIRLWKAGIINESGLLFLCEHKSFLELCTSSLFQIVSDYSTPKQVLLDIQNHVRCPQLIKDYIKYIHDREKILFHLLPQSTSQNFSIPEQYCINRIYTPIIQLDNLHERSVDKIWQNQKKSIYFETNNFNVWLFESSYGRILSHNHRYIIRKKYRDLELERKYRHVEYTRKYGLRITFSNLEYYGIIFASHSQTLTNVLSELKNHPIAGVKALVANHHNVSQHSLNRLIDDPNSEVRSVALSNSILELKMKQDLVRLEDPSISAMELLKLSHSKHVAIRNRVARHPNIDVSVLTQLAHDKLSVLIELANNPNTPANILLEFATHPNLKLPMAVAQNPGAPVNLLTLLATEVDKKGGFHFHPINLAAIKTLLDRDRDSAIIFILRCLKMRKNRSYDRWYNSVLEDPVFRSSSPPVRSLIKRFTGLDKTFLHNNLLI